MHTGIISFCDRIAFNIKCSDAKDWILDELEKKYHLRILQKHWFKLDDQQFKYVQTIPHWVSLRSNGNPYFVYFTKYEDVQQIMYIDKKVQPGYQKPRIILTKGQFAEDVYQNTLIEGEMVKDKNQQWVFLINDILIYKGRYLQDQPLPKRLNYIYEMLENHYQPDDLMDVCQFQVKKYYECDQVSIQAMLLQSNDMPYTNRGIYFMPHNSKYKPKLMNFDDTLVKNVFRKVKDMPEFQEGAGAGARVSASAAEEVTVRQPNVSIPVTPSRFDRNEKLFWLRKTDQPDVYDMFEQENSQQKAGVAAVPSLVLSKMLRSIFRNLNVATSVPFKCVQLDAGDTQKWMPKECLSENGR